MSFLPFLHFFCIIVYTYLAGFVLYKDPKSLLNKTCSALLICFTIWNFSDIFSHNPSSGLTKETAMLLQNISSLGWIGFASALLCFSLAFSKKEKILKSRIFILIISIILSFLIYKQWTNCLTIAPIRQPYGWEFDWSDSIWPFFFYAYYILFTSLAIYFIWNHRMRTKRLLEKKQAAIITASIAISLVMGTVSDVIIPELGIKGIPPMADVLVLIFAMSIVYAIVKYRFLTITVAAAADNIISTMTECVILSDTDGKIIFANRMAGDLLGCKENELEGKSIKELFGEEPDIISRKDIKNCDSFLKTKNGRSIPVILSSSAIYEETGDHVGNIFVARDITERKQAEEEKEKLQLQLIQAEKMSAVGQLAAGVAHEVKNPLEIIIQGVNYLEGKAPLEKEELNKVLSMIKEAVFRSDRVIRGLLNFSRPASLELKPQKIDEIIDAALDLVTQQLFLKEIKISKEYQKEIPEIRLDENQIKQVFINIILNASDAMPKGGGLFIRVYLKEKKNLICEIEDTGCGIPLDKLSKIFDPFYTTKPVGQGVGLGLSISRTIIESHKGLIQVESREKKGTKVTIILPLAE